MKTTSIRDAARRLRCERGTITGLRAAGHLQMEGNQVYEKDLASFESDFTSLARLVKDSGTSSRRIRRLAELAAVPVLIVADTADRSQAFLRRADIVRLGQLAVKQVQAKHLQIR